MVPPVSAAGGAARLECPDRLIFRKGSQIHGFEGGDRDGRNVLPADRIRKAGTEVPVGRVLPPLEPVNLKDPIFKSPAASGHPSGNPRLQSGIMIDVLLHACFL